MRLHLLTFIRSRSSKPWAGFNESEKLPNVNRSKFVSFNAQWEMKKWQINFQSFRESK